MSYIVKFVNKIQHALDLIEGKIFMLPVGYYATLPKENGNGRSDKSEGEIFPHFYIGHDYPIFCSYYLNDDRITRHNAIDSFSINRKVIDGFDCANGYVVVIPFQSFENHLRSPAHDFQGWQIEGGLINYESLSNQKSNQIISNTALWKYALMHKSQSFNYQNEFRLICNKSMTKEILSHKSFFVPFIGKVPSFWKEAWIIPIKQLKSTNNPEIVVELSADYRAMRFWKSVKIFDKYLEHKKRTNSRFDQLKANEEELNRIFAEIYGMVGEVPIEVEDKYVSVTRIYDSEDEIPESMKGNRYVQTKRDVIVSLISYAVGCMFGRYSLDVDGLVLANQGDGIAEYLAKMPDPEHVTFMPDKDAILPITDTEYFQDDIVARFVEFVCVAYGDDTLEENLQFVADALGGKGTAREVIRSYFLKEFFADHCKTYKKRPIYWLFDAGKKNGFKALTYIHRYTPDLLARLRTDYVHELQDRYETQLKLLNDEEQSAAASKKAALNKRIKKLRDQQAEIAVFEEKVHHLADQMIAIDLDDGVKVNYAKFQDVLAPIK